MAGALERPGADRLSDAGATGHSGSMSWLAAQIFRRYQDRRARQHAAHGSGVSPALHPILGLGGR